MTSASSPENGQDLVARLRHMAKLSGNFDLPALFNEAADEIERLRAGHAQQQDQKPVAYRYRKRRTKHWALQELPVASFDGDGIEVEPLYAALSAGNAGAVEGRP